jgi:hypothetical protein
MRTRGSCKSFHARSFALLALSFSTAVLAVAPLSGSAAHSRAASARAVPPNLCTVNLKAQLQAIPSNQISVADCSTTVLGQSPGQGGRIAETSYGMPGFTVQVLSGYSASFLAQDKQLYGNQQKVSVGSWGRETGNTYGVQLEAVGHNVIVYVLLNGHGDTTYPNYQKFEKPFVALAAAVLAHV